MSLNPQEYYDSIKPAKLYSLDELTKLQEHLIALENERHEKALQALQVVYPELQAKLKKRGYNHVSGRTLTDTLQASLPGGPLNPNMKEPEEMVNAKLETAVQYLPRLSR